MPTNELRSRLPPNEPPQVEVWLAIGEAVRLGDSVLRVLDTDGEETMLRIDKVSPEDAEDETCWAELPR